MTEPSKGPEVEAAPPAPVVSFKKRGPKGNIRKRPASPEPTAHDSDSDSSFSEDDSNPGHRIKRRQKHAGVVTAGSKSKTNSAKTDAELFPNISQTANPKIPLNTASNDATKASNWYDEDTQQKAKVGPTKAASTNVRMTTTLDFAPDVCKDYKKTGYCGFGDNCVFLHDRSDYKQGWELDREWEKVTQGKINLGGTVVASANRNNGAGGQDEDDEEEAMLKNIPFACIICEQAYKHPVITKCGHYFCEACALKRYRKDPSCAACGSGTNGVFNSASKLNKLLEKKRERAEKRRQAAIEAGEEVSSDDE
ncbi:RNA-splicing factor [Onygenales sp. PD_40]|nr:RNA-splicing factor [Onygenales sp. PD_40]KAK2775364.1 RNA-splicing factor [Emmonsiellopsis sp. PD_33]KAK2787259.1 RNA-splicing factor [Onygenales sp. PD_10]KAK2792638.1 RNA-splicing factor [Onygenales sp. PD_12]